MDCKKSEAEITERAPGITKKCLWSKGSTYAIFYENSSENGVLKEKIDIFNAGYLLDQDEVDPLARTFSLILAPGESKLVIFWPE
jgi:hypothetical protein